LNDNLGIKDFDGNITYLDDLHLLPFDGVVDWNGAAARLNKYNYQGELTFELNRKSKPNRYENDGYGKISLLEYVTEAYKRACKVAYLKRNR
jgi:sugar phosphate isomerase/epimerase